MSTTVDYLQLIFLFYACVVLTRIMWNTNSLNEVNFKRGLHIMTSEWKRNVDKERNEYKQGQQKKDEWIRARLQVSQSKSDDNWVQRDVKNKIKEISNENIIQQLIARVEMIEKKQLSSRWMWLIMFLLILILLTKH